MISYLFTLDFQFNRELCNPDPTLDPLMTPEGIAKSHSVDGSSGNVGVSCPEYVRGELNRCVARTTHEVSDASGDSDLQLIADQLMGLFLHLPGFNLVSLDYKKIDPNAEIDAAPTVAGPDIKQFKLQCRFRSTVPFLELLAGFKEHIADGNLVGNGAKPQEYVAFVNLGAVSADSLEDAVETLLARAFTTDAQNSSDCFHSIKTTLL